MVYLLLPVNVSAEETGFSERLTRVPDALIFLGEGPDRYALVVEKTSHRILLIEYKDGEYYLRHSFPCGTGRNIGPKLRKGDRKTPSGYLMFTGRRSGRYLEACYGPLAFTTDYPNYWDQRVGKTGGSIMMHGTNRRLAPRISGGCIRLNNPDVLTLGKYVKTYDTPFVLYEKIKYKQAKELKEEAAKVKEFVRRWQKSREDRDTDILKSMYAQNFRSNAGRKFDRRLLADLDDLVIYRHHDVIVVAFDRYNHRNGKINRQDFKRLYLQEKDGHLKIAAEIRRPLPYYVKRKPIPPEANQRLMAQAARYMLVTAKAAKPALPLKMPRLIKIADSAQIIAATPASWRQNHRGGPLWVINALATVEDKKVQPLVKALDDIPYRVYSFQAKWKGQTWYAVRVGFFNTRREAKQLGEKLAARHKLPQPWILKAHPLELAKYDTP